MNLTVLQMCDITALGRGMKLTLENCVLTGNYKGKDKRTIHKHCTLVGTFVSYWV